MSDAVTSEPRADQPVTETTDAFHRGAFHILQPKGRGHRSGMDAMLLAALVDDERAVKVADLGAGAGAAGLAVASRLPKAEVVLFERSAEMADYARRSLDLADDHAGYVLGCDGNRARHNQAWRGGERQHQRSAR